MRTLLQVGVVLAVAAASPTVATAQRQADIEAINRLLDRYASLEDSMDLTAQAQLMAADRVQIGQAIGRRTDQALNMRIQQAGLDQLRKAVPAVQFFTEDRDRLIKVYGNGTVAVASFYRYRTRILPAGTPREVAEGLAPIQPTAMTLVLEKQNQNWTIVHTHFSTLAPSGN
jgi:hypothetical protein